MSHEIRTPLNEVLGLTELLKTTRLDVSQRETLDSVGVGAQAVEVLRVRAEAKGLQL